MVCARDLDVALGASVDLHEPTQFEIWDRAKSEVLVHFFHHGVNFGPNPYASGFVKRRLLQIHDDYVTLGVMLPDNEWE